jgi:PadR family transcriptional regulator, regulatory protein PadR
MDMNLINNLISELKRGTQILAVLSQLRENQYGYSLLQTLEEKGVVIEAGTLYPLLRRLESQGLLQSEWDTSESKPRKYYILSQDGIETYDTLIKEWRKIIIEMDLIIKEEAK